MSSVVAVASARSPSNKRPGIVDGCGAFTLIELSIVLVIIGLLAGGVILGRDLIDIAEARSLMSQMEEFEMAAHTFRLKFDCKAGDCNKASQFGLGTNGTGDGLIGARYGSSATAFPSCLSDGSNCVTDRPLPAALIWSSVGEHQLFFAHLSTSLLIRESILSNSLQAGVDQLMTQTYPRDALGKHYLLATTWNNKLYIRTGLATVGASNGDTYFSREGTLTSAQMHYITSKFDYPVIINTGFPTALLNGQRIIPIKPPHNVSWNFYRSPELFQGGASPPDNPTCVRPDGAGGYQYNITGGGRCDMLWQIDY